MFCNLLLIHFLCKATTYIIASCTKKAITFSKMYFTTKTEHLYIAIFWASFALDSPMNLKNIPYQPHKILKLWLHSCVHHKEINNTSTLGTKKLHIKNKYVKPVIFCKSINRIVLCHGLLLNCTFSQWHKEKWQVHRSK